MKQNMEADYNHLYAFHHQIYGIIYKEGAKNYASAILRHHFCVFKQLICKINEQVNPALRRHHHGFRRLL